MVVIRLGRQGSKNNPKYRITVADSRRSPTGRFIEKIGSYDPKIKDLKKGLFLNLDRANHWIFMGAKPSQRIKSLIRSAKEIKEGNYKVKNKKKKKAKQKKKTEEKKVSK